MSSLRQPFVSGVVAYQHVSRPVTDILSNVCDFYHHTVSDFLLQNADDDEMNSYLLFVSLFLHIVHLGIVMY